MDKYIASSANVAAVNRFYKKMKKHGYEIRTMQIYKDGELKLRIAQAPYSCSYATEIYSLSKTFTSTVVGIAADKGFLSPEDNVLKYFPEIETDNEYFHKMKIKHVLSMNTGHEACVMPHMSLSDDAVKGFFSVPPTREPGSYFTYNTGATCLLGIIVSRATGMDFFDFAAENLFYPLGIHNAYWSRCKDGSCMCGAGLHISSDDILKLFRMYLNKGIYSGKRILSESWIDAASSKVSDNEHNGTKDWASGYGYQIWLQENGGYRGDGAFGQLGLVLPQYNAVAVVQAVVGDMQTEVDAVIDLIKELDAPSDEEADDYSFPANEKLCDLPKVDLIYKLDENVQGFGTAHLIINEEGASISFSDKDKHIITLNAGNGCWRESSFRAKNMCPVITELMPTDIPESIRSVACISRDDSKLVFNLRYLTTPLNENYNISYSEDELDIYISLGIRNEESRHIKGKCRK